MNYDQIAMVRRLRNYAVAISFALLLSSIIPEISWAAAKGQLRLITKPIAAPVYVNNRLKGAGEVTLKLKPGSYSVSFGAYNDYQLVSPQGRKKVLVVRGKTTKVTATYTSAISATPTPTATPTATNSIPWQQFHKDGNHLGRANVVGPKSLTFDWKFRAANGGNSAPPNSIAIDSAGVIYLGAPAAIFALNSDGTLKWSQSYSGVQGPALSADETVVYFAANNSVVAVSALDGTQVWKVNLPNTAIFGPTISPLDGTIVQGCWDRNLYAINPSGTTKWTYPTGGAVSYPSSIDSNGKIFLGGGDAHAGPDPYVYALDKDGNTLWTYNSNVTRNGTPTISGTTIYVPAAPSLLALNASTGTLLWKLGPSASLPAPGDATGILAPSIGSDGTIYTGTSQGLILAINPTNQSVKWSYQTGPASSDATYGAPTPGAVDAEGNYFTGAFDGKVYAFSKDGEVLATYQTGDKIAEAAPALGADGRFFISSDDGYLYAFKN